jgi:hypothetical protein
MVLPYLQLPATQFVKRLQAALAPAFKRGLSPQVTGGVLLPPPALRAATSLTSAGGKRRAEKEKDIWKRPVANIDTNRQVLFGDT